MYAIHSIVYEKLPEYFFVFAIRARDFWLPWDSIKLLCKLWEVRTVPEVFRGKFNTAKQIQEFMDAEINKPSAFGSTREGFVIRYAGMIDHNDFQRFVAKFVRKGHVQTDEHWTKRWKKATLFL